MLAEGLEGTRGGTELNFGSPLQAQLLLYGMLGLPISLRAKVTQGSQRHKLGFPGAPATDAKALDQAVVDLLTEDPDDWRIEVVRAIQAVRSIDTRFELYYRPYPLWKRPDTGRVHAAQTNCATVTRRLNGRSPNIQQVQKHGELRRIFVPPGPEYVLVTADFDGQEIRLMASESKDPTLLEAYLGNPRRDIHSLTATAIAPIVLPREKPHLAALLPIVNESGACDYQRFEAYRRARGEEDQEIAQAVSKIRNQYGKACIAKGSLVLTDQGLVPIEKVTLTHRVWDGVDFVTHAGVIYRGIKQVVLHHGLTATPDHEVYLNDGRKVPIGSIASEQTGSSIAVGEIKGAPVRFTAGAKGVLEGLGGHGHDFMHSLRKSNGEARLQPVFWKDEKLPMAPPHIEDRSASRLGSEVQGHGTAMPEPQIEVLPELRGQGGEAAVQLASRVYRLGTGESAACVLSRRTDRQEGQQRALRARELTVGVAAREPEQQTQYPIHAVSWSESGAPSPLASIEDGPSRVQFGRRLGNPFVEERKNSRAGSRASTTPRWAPVYDIVNAGPRHRFTVSGKIVSNCNFLVTYGGGAATLARNIGIEQPLAQAFIDGFFRRYPRVADWMEEVKAFARSHLYVETAYGNRRHLGRELLGEDGARRHRLERQAVHAVIEVVFTHHADFSVPRRLPGAPLARHEREQPRSRHNPSGDGVSERRSDPLGSAQWPLPPIRKIGLGKRVPRVSRR